MPVRERGSAWQADVIVGGRRKRRDFPTREAAEAWEAETREEMKASRTPDRRRRGAAPEPSADTPGDGTKGTPRTLGDAVERAFNRYYRGTVWASKNWQMMGRVLAHFGRDFPLSRMDTDAVDTLIESMKAHGKAGSTINGHLSVLSKSLRYAYDRGGLAKMPRIERVSVHNLRLRWLAPEEEEMLLSLFRQWGREDVREVVEVLIDTGLRPSELWALTPKDVVLPGQDALGMIRVWQGVHAHLKQAVKRTKNGEERTIYMTDRVAGIIAARVKLTAPNGRLFPYDNFWLRSPWERARFLMGMSKDPNFVPYICRHTCASRMVQRNVPIPVIQKWMGHKNIQVTMRYANVAPENLRDACAAMNRGAA
jgi:integrase